MMGQMIVDEKGGGWQGGGGWQEALWGELGVVGRAPNSKAGRDSNDTGWHLPPKAWRGPMGLEHTCLFGGGRTVC